MCGFHSIVYLFHSILYVFHSIFILAGADEFAGRRRNKAAQDNAALGVAYTRN